MNAKRVQNFLMSGKEARKACIPVRLAAEKSPKFWTPGAAQSGALP